MAEVKPIERAHLAAEETGPIPDQSKAGVDQSTGTSAAASEASDAASVAAAAAEAQVQAAAEAAAQAAALAASSAVQADAAVQQTSPLIVATLTLEEYLQERSRFDKRVSLVNAFHGYANRNGFLRNTQAEFDVAFNQFANSPA